MSEKIFEMLNLFYANKHLYEKIKKVLTNNNTYGIIIIERER